MTTAPKPGDSPPAYLFDIIGFDELAQEDGGALGVSPPEGYHLRDWKLTDEAVVVCWENHDSP